MVKRKTPLKRKSPLKRSVKKYVSKQKVCSGCGYKGKLWSASLCKRCSAEKNRKPPEDGTITQGMVHQVFSWLVRTLYPNFCHACKKPLPYKHLQCCHMVKRDNMIVTWDLRNCYPGCEDCNYRDPNHEILLAAQCDRYWGIGTAEHIALEGKKAYHWAPFELEELYKIFLAALREAEDPNVDKKELRERVLAQTKRAA